MNEFQAKVETSDVASLKPHPRNYRAHPQDEILHLQKSIRDNGIYRNVVVSADGFILAGHGVVEAAKSLGIEKVPVYKLALNHDHPAAIKILVGDNEIAHLGERDDRLLSELLKQIKDSCDGGLVGTGYDEMMLANLVLVTRPSHEIPTIDRALEWVGMPECEQGQRVNQIIVSFESEEHRKEFCELIGINHASDPKSTWFPPRTAKDDVRSVKFVG